MNPMELIGEAAEWRLISLLFECPSETWRRQAVELGREVGDPELRTAAASAQTEASEGLYHSIFGPGGPAPPREASYSANVQLGYLMAELSRYYHAFAYDPVTPEPADHVSVEAGFLAYLRLKQAYALAGEESERAAIASQAARQFLDDHLSRIAQPLAASLAGSGVDYLARASAALLRRTGPSRTLPVVAAGESDCEIACGG